MAVESTGERDEHDFCHYIVKWADPLRLIEDDSAFALESVTLHQALYTAVVINTQVAVRWKPFRYSSDKMCPTKELRLIMNATPNQKSDKINWQIFYAANIGDVLTCFCFQPIWLNYLAESDLKSVCDY